MKFRVKIDRFAMAMSSNLTTIIQSVMNESQPTHVTGAPPIARALILSQLAISTQGKPWIVICPTDDVASDLAIHIETLSTTALTSPLETCVFPTWEQSLFSPIAPSIKTRFNRLASLSSISDNPPQHTVYITTLAASCQAGIPKEVFLKNSLRLKINQDMNTRESILEKLLNAGYIPSDPVEDPGTFTVRGDIIDLFPPNRKNPIRIELFDTYIEKIREFDATTQRTVGSFTLETLLIPPAREILIQNTNAPLIREQLKKKADEHGISRALRDPILESVHAGMYPDHSEAWAPFAYPQRERFWNYVPDSWPVVWYDQNSCLEEWHRFQEDQNKLAKEGMASGVILPDPTDLFCFDEELQKKINGQSRLYLDQLEITSEKKGVPLRVVAHPNTSFSTTAHPLKDLEPQFRLWLQEGFKILILALTESQIKRIRFLLEERHLFCQEKLPPQPSTISISTGSLLEGLLWQAEGLVILTESEILGSKHVKKQTSHKKSTWTGLQALADLTVGDAVVHRDHGIGRYQGLLRLGPPESMTDFLLLEYANHDKLYLPVYRLNVIQKYVGSSDKTSLDRLGSQQFLKAKERVRESVKTLAFDLVQLYAKRKIQSGLRFSAPDAQFREFEMKFPFDETPDQLKAIEDCFSDMESGKVMDRLICGDVGYGKTEVAIRAAFKAVSEGKQVAVLVPTTLLAHQHEQSFQTRMKDYPILIESLSRFKSPKEQKEVLERLKLGKTDVAIGTHRLLSRDVQFHDLGLLIIDEEHRFGVEHKEKLKSLKINTHVLTLSATPIPRSLHMALSGLREISIMNTPPMDRLPIRTFVSKYDEGLIRRAIETELNRGGQVFFLHNRVQSIHEMANTLQKLLPQVPMGIAHGQMTETQLEKAMVAFYQKKTQVLVCTSIIEAGIDMPSVNTLIVNRADTFGLAQLYQIRGRVGRGQHRAYAYLLLPERGTITDEAKQRLEIIQRFVELGSGFSIATHDLELRGGGDLLGPDQSGFIAAVGFDLYTELLEEAIHELQGKPVSASESQREPEIKTPFPAYFSENYIPDVHQRLSLYRRLSASSQEVELTQLEEELRDRFGPPPAEAQNLFWLIRTKQLLKKVGIDALTVGGEKTSMVPSPQNFLDPARVIAWVTSRPQEYQLMPDSKLIVKMTPTSLHHLYFDLERLFGQLTNSC